MTGAVGPVPLDQPYHRASLKVAVGATDTATPVTRATSPCGGEPVPARGPARGAGSARRPGRPRP